MDKFIADSDYGDSDQKSNSEGSYLTNSYGRGNSVNSYKGEVLKLRDISIQKFTDELKTSLNKKAPMFLWSKRRQNEKILLDNEKQVLILNKIQNLRAIGNELINLKAGAIFDEEYIQLLVADKKMLAQQYFEKTIADHNLYLTKVISEINLTNSLADHDEIEKDRKKLENERIMSEIEKTRAETNAINTQEELKRLVMSKIDFDNFPPAYISKLVMALSNINIESSGEFERNEKLNDITVNMEQTKVRKAQAEVEDFMNSAEFKKWQFNRDKKAAEKNDKL